MSAQRFVTALIIGPAAILLILFANNAWFALVIAVSLLGGLWEWARIAGFSSRLFRVVLLVLVAVLLWFIWHLSWPWLWTTLAAIGAGWWLLALFWLRQLTFAASPTLSHAWLKLGAGLLALLPTWAALVALHDGGMRRHVWTLLALLIVWAADSGAYMVGVRFGRRHLAPSISPGKTWEGVFGGTTLALLFAAGGAWLLDIRGFELILLLGIALLTVFFSIVGDLFESLLKRQAVVKDSGAMFPGHGGLLDRMDSMLAALPWFYILTKIIFRI